MKVFLTGISAAVIGLAVIGTVQAGGRPSHSVGPIGRFGHPASHIGGHLQVYANYHLSHGTKFEHGYFYKGTYHKHWSHCYLDKRYGCYLYYDPCCSSYYYYCAPKACYYPVTYCPYQTYSWNQPAYYQTTAAPAAVAPAPLVNTAVIVTSAPEGNNLKLPSLPANPIPLPGTVP